MNKETYERLEMGVTKLSHEDVITTSGGLAPVGFSPEPWEMHVDP